MDSPARSQRIDCCTYTVNTSGWPSSAGCRAAPDATAAAHEGHMATVQRSMAAPQHCQSRCYAGHQCHSVQYHTAACSRHHAGYSTATFFTGYTHAYVQGYTPTCTPQCSLEPVPRCEARAGACTSFNSNATLVCRRPPPQQHQAPSQAVPKVCTHHGGCVATPHRAARMAQFTYCCDWT
jgi:hypothetical protein